MGLPPQGRLLVNLCYHTANPAPSDEGMGWALPGLEQQELAKPGRGGGQEAFSCLPVKLYHTYVTSMCPTRGHDSPAV